MFEIKNVSMIYDMNSDDKMYALNNINLTLPDAGLIGVVGPSGSGKKHALYVMSTLKKSRQREASFTMGKNLQRLQINREKMSEEMNLVLYFKKHYLVPYMTAMDNVVVAATDENAGAREKASKYLKALGLKDREFGKRPSKLSGGQCQRVAIARAMINNQRSFLQMNRLHHWTMKLHSML